MGSKKTTNTTEIPGASQAELLLRQLLGGVAGDAAGQLGDLSQLAGGQIGSPTGADQELIAASIERARQLAENQVQVSGQVQQAQLRENLQGATDSSREVAANLLQSLGTQQSIDQSVLQAGQQGGQALLNLPFQRAQTQLGANQALFQRIVGAASPVLAGQLQERIAQPTTTQETSGFDLTTLAQLGGAAAGAFFNPAGAVAGAASGAASGAAGSVGSASAPSLLQGFQSGLRQR